MVRQLFHTHMESNRDYKQWIISKYNCIISYNIFVGNLTLVSFVSQIRNTSKIKRMKKKQLRKIEKRDTLALLQKSQKQNEKAKGPRNSNADKDLT